MKTWKTNLVEKLVEEVEVKNNRYFFFRPLANALGINHIAKNDILEIVNKFSNRCPNMKAYYDNSDKNSLFLWSVVC